MTKKARVATRIRRPTMGKLRQACEARPRPPESRELGANGDLRLGSFFTTLGIVGNRVGSNIVWRLSAVSPLLRETSGVEP
jgi:hypothetical protein